MSTSIAPDAASEPTMAEAFGELANAIADEGDDAETTSPASSDSPTPADAATPPTAGAPDAPAKPAAPAATQPTTTEKPGAPAPIDAQKPADADPLAGQTPLSYIVNGETRTFDGAIELPGRGAIIPQEHLPRLKDRLQQADRLQAQNQQYYAQVQEYQQLGGRDGIAAVMAQRALLDATGALLVNALGNPETLMVLATDPIARQQLLKEITLVAREAQFTEQNRFRETLGKHYASQQQAHQNTENARLAIHNAVGQIATMFPGMSEEDATFVRDHAWKVQSAIVRPATAEEARTAGVQPGQSIIDVALLHQWLSDRHALRQQISTAAQRAETDAKENAARLAAAAPAPQGKPAAARPGAGKPPAKAPKTLDEMSSSEITRAMRTGRIFDLIDSEQ